MNLKAILQTILSMAAPLLKELVENKIIPALVRKSYERFDDISNDMIEKLADLHEKIKNTENEAKKQAHLAGFELGVKTLRKVGEKLLEACNVLETQIV